MASTEVNKPDTAESIGPTMTDSASSSAKQFQYDFPADEPLHTDDYLHGPLLRLMGEIKPGTRVLDVGCGHGTLSSRLLKHGVKLVGLDASEAGIARARRMHPEARWECMLADEKILTSLGEAPFDVVMSTEVVEHLYDPKSFIRGCVSALKPGGRLVISTPYHGYVKNLVMAILDKWDSHHSPLWDGGHIKFWSRATLTQLMVEEGGVEQIEFAGAGRFPGLWKSMLLSGRKPAR